jgi:hypothetical protein
VKHARAPQPKAPLYPPGYVPPPGFVINPKTGMLETQLPLKSATKPKE